MEQLLHYCWKHRLLPLGELHTTDGRVVEVIDPGLYNRRHAGPDFFNAKVKLDGTLWVGNVEIHDRASDWYAHGHDHDAAYDNVVLHVCRQANKPVVTNNGLTLPQLEIEVPERVRQNYEQLLSEDQYPPCYRIIPSMPALTIHAWMSALQTERLEQKTVAIEERAQRCNGSWEAAYFITLARNYGFGVNGDAFETWAQSVPLNSVAHHRDDLFQVEAMFMGQAGLLNLDFVPERYHNDALSEGYFTRLRNEYLYLQHKFSLQPMDANLWRFLRLRPQNFPHIRIAQLARLYYERKAGLSQLLEYEKLDDLRKLMQTQVTPYWETHYLFGATSAQSEKHLAAGSIDLIIINTVVPMLFAYGRTHSKDLLCDRSFDLLEQLRAENNHITRMWQQCGLEVRSAGDSQALIQLKRMYCDRRDCLRCRIGYEYLKRDK
ncbi:MAG: DUF2851 family protein [Prevotella sp.]|nr:DUF2851 family protein [Prevotella sp.]